MMPLQYRVQLLGRHLGAAAVPDPAVLQGAPCQWRRQCAAAERPGELLLRLLFTMRTVVNERNTRHASGTSNMRWLNDRVSSSVTFHQC